MKLRNRIIIIALIFVSVIAINCTSVFAEYVVQVVPNATGWNYISVSDAYDACQNLNTTYSTLGTTSLKAHLTTNADWYAVSLLTYSAYGAKSPGNTTGNKSGITNMGEHWQSPIYWMSALVEGYTSNTYIESLANAAAAGSPYVEIVKKSTDRASNQPGRGLLLSECVTTTRGDISGRYGNNSGAMGRYDLFGLYVGNTHNTGAASQYVYFRPAIWNK